MLNVGLPFSLFLPRPREEHLYLCNLKYLPAMFTLLKFLPCPRKMTSEKSEMYALVCQDFCYYANTIFLVDPLMYPKNEKLFMVCFSFAEVREESFVAYALSCDEKFILLTFRIL